MKGGSYCQIATHPSCSLVVAGAGHGTFSSFLGFLAVTCATINVVGGFWITERMLKFFKKKETARRNDE